MCGNLGVVVLRAFIIAVLCFGCTPTNADDVRLIILEPAAGSVYEPGDSVTVTIEAENGFVPDVIHVSSEAGTLVLSQPPFTDSFQIPAEAIGKLTIVALGMTKSRDGVAVSDPVDIEVKVNAKLIDIVEPKDSVLVGSGTHHPIIRVLGEYDDGITRDISGSKIGTTYVSDSPSWVSVDAEGVVTGFRDGRTSIWAYNGESRAEFPVSVFGVNALPVITFPRDPTIYVGDYFEVTIKTQDRDGVIPELKVERLPDGAFFSDNRDGTGIFSWTPRQSDLGVHVLKIIAIDGADPEYKWEIGAAIIVKSR